MKSLFSTLPGRRDFVALELNSRIAKLESRPQRTRHGSECQQRDCQKSAGLIAESELIGCSSHFTAGEQFQQA